jgi:hypothetical protein
MLLNRSNLFCNGLIALGVGIASLAGGCASAPKDLASGASWVAEKHKVSDASVQSVKGMPYLRFDAATRAELNQSVRADNLESAREGVMSSLAAAYAIGERSSRFELDRMDDDAWLELNQRYFGVAVVPGSERRDEVRARISASHERGYADLAAEARSLDDVEELQAFIASIDENIEGSIKTNGRDARALPWIVFAGASRAAADEIYEETPRGSIDRDFAGARLIEPAVFVKLDDAEPATSEHWALLSLYAPVIVQEMSPKAKYDPSCDEFGEVLADSRNEIRVETDQPAMYAYARVLPIHDEQHVQLVYTFWYPRQVQADGKKGKDTGLFDGPTVRITLDENNEPIFFETLDACGCYHRMYPTRAVEQAAADQFGEAVGAGLSPVEQCTKGKKSLVMGRVLENPDPGARPVVRTTAGDHSIIDVSFTLGSHADEVRETAGYTLLPYARLEHIPLDDGSFTSMFYENGLVKGAQREYGKYFTPMGILSAGQPRQRGTQLIMFDDWDFDDPALFEQAIRWPAHALVHPERHVRATTEAE